MPPSIRTSDVAGRYSPARRAKPRASAIPAFSQRHDLDGATGLFGAAAVLRAAVGRRAIPGGLRLTARQRRAVLRGRRIVECGSEGNEAAEAAPSNAKCHGAIPGAARIVLDGRGGSACTCCFLPLGTCPRQCAPRATRLAVAVLRRSQRRLVVAAERGRSFHPTSALPRHHSSWRSACRAGHAVPPDPARLQPIVAARRGRVGTEECQDAQDRWAAARSAGLSAALSAARQLTV
jgi:hypothetical protein